MCYSFHSSVINQNNYSVLVDVCWQFIHPSLCSGESNRRIETPLVREHVARNDQAVDTPVQWPVENPRRRCRRAVEHVGRRRYTARVPGRYVGIGTTKKRNIIEHVGNGLQRPRCSHYLRRKLHAASKIAIGEHVVGDYKDIEVEGHLG